MRKADVERSYHQGHHGDPMINVKHHLWVPDLITRWRLHGHEYSGIEPFWDWVQERYDADDSRVFDLAEDAARELCWELAEDWAREIWPATRTELVHEKRWSPEHRRPMFTGRKVPVERHLVQVYSAGRMGGWLVVTGLGDVDDWDLMDLNRWAKFQRHIRTIADEDYPYDFVWQLHERWWAEVVEPMRVAAEAGAQRDSAMWDAIVTSTGGAR